MKKDNFMIIKVYMSHNYNSEESHDGYRTT